MKSHYSMFEPMPVCKSNKIFMFTCSRRRGQRQPEVICSGALICRFSYLFFHLVEEIEGRGVTPLDGEDESKRHKGLLSS